MNLQWAGPLLGLVTFLTIGAGHVMVRWLHKKFRTLPGIPLFLLGALLLLIALRLQSDLASAALGITAITVLWDGLEMYRQEKRFLRGEVEP